MSGRKIALICCIFVLALFFSSSSAPAPQCGCAPFACPALGPEASNRPVNPRINYFTARKNTIKPGDPVTLGWSIENADAAWIEGESGGRMDVGFMLGEMGIHPTTTSRYTLYATSSKPTISTKKVSASLTITVQQPQTKPPSGTSGSDGNCD